MTKNPFSKKEIKAMSNWEKRNPHKRGEYNAEYFRRWLRSRTCKKYFPLMVKRLLQHK